MKALNYTQMNINSGHYDHNRKNFEIQVINKKLTEWQNKLEKWFYVSYDTRHVL